MSLSFLDIAFFLDGKVYAQRYWNVCPRVGDEVLLGGKDAKKVYRVVRVLWGAEDEEHERWNRQAVNIEIELIEGG